MALITMKQLLRNTPIAWLLAISGGALSSSLGLSVMIGWFTHNVTLIQVSAVFVPMQFNTALGFLLSGLGLLLTIKGYRGAGTACGIFVLLTGLLTLTEYILGIDLGIDQLLMQHYITVETSHPGRMAPNTALCFSLTGAALVMLGTRVNVWKPALIAGILGSLIFGLGFIALTGYLISFEAIYGWGELTRMAVHTASSFIVLGVALTSLAWHLSVTESSKVPAWLPMPVGLGVMTIIISLWQALESHETQLMQQYNVSEDYFFLNDMLLVVGIVLAAAFSLAVYLAQVARNREREVVKMNSRLTTEINERKMAEEVRNKLLHDMGERVKEITCLYGVTESIQNRSTLEEIFQDVAELIPAGWHYPEITRSKLIFDGREYVSVPFEQTEWKQTSDIIVNGELRGSIEVYYLEEKPELDEGPFMTEERHLINGLSSKISRVIEHKQAEEKLNKVNRLYATLSQVNQAIIRTHDRQKLFQEICNVAVEFGQFRLAWIGLLDEENKLFKPVAFSGEGSDCLQQIEISLGNDMARHEPVIRSIMEGKSVVFNDLRNNPDSVPWCTLALEKSCLSSATFPLRLHDSTIGTLNVCAAEYSYFDEDETGLLEEMAMDISFALETFEEEKNRKLAEEVLKRSEEKFRGLLESASDSMVLVNQRGEITLVNKQLEQMTGYSREELIGQPMEKLVPERVNDHKQQRDDYLAKPRTRPMGKGKELYIRHKDGREVPVEISLNPLETEEELIVSAIIVDITERKQAMEIIEQYAHIFEDSLNEIYLFDVDSLKFVQVNSAAQHNLGFSMEELQEMTPVDIKPEFKTESYRELLVPLRTGEKEVIVFETVHRRKDKSLYDVEVHLQLLKHKRETLFVAFILDITDRKKQEAALNQAQKMEAVGQLTGGIAHDFNNLLSIISGNLRFLRQDIGETSQDIDELFEDAISAVDDGAELTQRLLGFSRNRILQTETMNVNDTIEKFIRFLSRSLADNTELDIVLPEENLFISVDPSQLENALLNLSLNARDSMPEGGTITISATRYYHGDGDEYSLIIPEGDYVKISVIDMGSGISPEDLQHVYEPFFTTKEVGKGSGIGLSMVYGFTQQSHGGCHIDSTPGEGTTVSMYFPEVMDDEVIEQKTEDKKELASNTDKIILVVEDEPRVRRVALRDVKKLGYQTLEAGNADMAKTIIESGEPIDLLFSDVLMPGEMDGHMLAVWTEEHYPQIKIVLTSGYSKTKRELREDEAHHFPLIRKPYAIEKLAEQIRTTLEK